MGKDIHQDELDNDEGKDRGVVDERAIEDKVQRVADTLSGSGLTVKDFLEPDESIEITQDVGKYKTGIKKLLKLDQEVLQDSPGGDLENKMTSQDTISPQEIKDYGKLILNNLNLMKGNSREDQQAFIVDALSYKRIWEEFVEKFEGEAKGKGADPKVVAKEKENFEKERTDPEVIAAVERIRSLIIDQIKDHVDYVVLEKFGYGRTNEHTPEDTQIKNFAAGSRKIQAKNRNIIDLVKDVKTGKSFIYKDQAFLLEENENDFKEAFAVFLDLPKHPNIATVREYDRENHRVVYEAEKNLTTLKKFLESSEFDKSKEQLVVALNSLRGTINGGAFLKQHGLALLDISPGNIGIVLVDEKSKSTKGMLFDLEYPAKVGALIRGRPIMRRAPIYMPPEAYSADNLPTPVQASEMTWQFGWCLKDVIDSFDRSNFVTPEQMNSLEVLFGSMTEEAPQDRISLTQAETELGRIINDMLTEKEIQYN